MKKENGFLMGDVAFAIMIVFMTVGVIGTSITIIYNIQITSQISSIATMYGIQVLEEIDRRDYEEIEELEYIQNRENFCNECRKKFNIPDEIKIEINIEKDMNQKTENTVKKLSLTLKMDIAKKSEEIKFNKLKVKEL